MKSVTGMQVVVQVEFCPQNKMPVKVGGTFENIGVGSCHGEGENKHVAPVAGHKWTCLPLPQHEPCMMETASVFTWVEQSSTCAVLVLACQLEPLS